MVSIKSIDDKLKKSVKKSPYRNKKLVFGEGNNKAKIIIVGQNPGTEEEKTGKPFVGKSGKYLNKILEKNKIKRKETYITNVVNIKTPNNRKPSNKEIKFFLPFLIEKIKTIKPKKIFLLGEVAWKTPKIDKIEYVKTYHPSAAMRFPKLRKKFEKDFKK